MAGVRMTGLVSGLDTEGLVAQLADAHKVKVHDVEKEKTKLQWKKEAWASLNTKIMDFYKGALSTFRSVSTYNAKSVSGDFEGLKIKAGTNAVNGSHKAQVISTASAQMWTGNKLNTGTYSATSYKAATADIKISDLKDSSGHSIGASLSGASFKVNANGVETEVKVNVGADATVQDALDNINEQLDGTGLTAKFENGKIALSNTSTLVETTTGDDETETTTYTGGHSITLSTDDELSSKVFGISLDSETVLDAQTESAKAGSTTGTEGYYQQVVKEGSKVTGNTKLTDLGIVEGTVIKVNGKEIAVGAKTTLSELAASMAKTGINASYDESQGRFYLSSKGTGEKNAFTVEADDATLAALGLNLSDSDPGKIAATDAKIVYNGVEYSSSSNSITVNGLTFEATEEGKEYSFTVENDIQGIYDKIKEFTTKYNELITEMNTLYSADKVKDYEPLTDEEKAAMSDEQIEQWEGLIKKSLLRRDDTIGSLLSSMRSILNGQVSVTGSDGNSKNYSLSSFGIVTGVYTENGALHIEGNSDDSAYADFADKLKKALSNNPDAVTKTLSSIGSKLYSSLQTAMKSSDLSSALTFYNDKQIDDELEEYDDRIDTLQEKLAKEEDKYYEQFAAMEAAMAKLQSQQSYIAQLFGG